MIDTFPLIVHIVVMFAILVFYIDGAQMTPMSAPAQMQMG